MFDALMTCIQLGDNEQSSNSELCRLRAVCRHLNERVEAKLFSRITVDINSHGPDIAAAQLEALALGSSRASHFAKALHIRSLHPVPRMWPSKWEQRDVDVPDDNKKAVVMVKVRENLRGAIISLKKVTSVTLVIPLNLF
jgi:hypothetical protein